MQIRELEAKSGLERATIRYYEREGFIQPKRHENGYREYSLEDCETLLKIKLLRKLGISLERIQDLQQGRADFSIALTEQIEVLEDKIRDATRAKNVCEQMRCDGVSYRTLNAEHYLKILDKSAYGTKPVTTAPVPEFQAKRYLKRHPVRRFAARTIDGTLLTSVFLFLFFVVFRIRFEVDLIWNILTFGCVFVSVPVNAFLISRFGTTPGKWVMGIRVLSCNGNLLSFEEAKDREWGVLRCGYGFNIPIYTWIRLIKSYREYIETYENDWYRDSEIIYENWTITKRVFAAVLVGIFSFLTVFSYLDMQRPLYRGENITISQFSKNYNYMCKQLFTEEMAQLGSNGEFMFDRYVSYGGAQPQFEFVLEGEYIKSIRYETVYLYALEDRELPSDCIAAAVTMAAAQKNIGTHELNNFIGRMRHALRECDVNTNHRSGEITVENVKVVWTETFDVPESMMNATYTIEVSLIN